MSRGQERLRRVKLNSGHLLVLWATERVDSRGQSYLGYLVQDHDGVLVARGEEFAGSPLHDNASDWTLRALISFLVYLRALPEECELHGLEEDPEPFVEVDDG